MKKNLIVYGEAGSGKTLRFVQELEEFEGTVIGIAINMSHNYFYDISKFNIVDYKKFDSNFSNDYISDNKTIIEFKSYNWSWQEGIINYIVNKIAKLDIKGPLLVAIDEFDTFKIEIKELLKLLNNENINVVLFMQGYDIDFYKRDMNNSYKYESIFEKCKKIPLKEYKDCSGEIRLRIPPLLHRDLTIRAKERYDSLNMYMQDVLRDFMINTPYEDFQPKSKECINIVKEYQENTNKCDVSNYTGDIVLRVPFFMHLKLIDVAKCKRISLNKLIITILSIFVVRSKAYE